MPNPRIADLICNSRGLAEAQEYLAFTADRSLAERIGAIGFEMLRSLDKLPGACAPMSALYTSILREQLPNIVIHMVAGKLFVGGACIFGATAHSTDWTQTFRKSSNDWDGHCWIVCDNYIVDISIFRTAYNSLSPPILARAVLAEFGSSRGIMIAENTFPLSYQPGYVLTDGQIDSLAGGALRLFDVKYV